MTELVDPDLVARARAWTAADPDPANQAEIDRLIAGDVHALQHRFDRRLQFGTAGLRGPMGAGPLRMNAVIVAQTARAIGAWLPAGALVVIGFDARHGSRRFAQVSAAVLTAAGHRVELFGSPMPTPVVAFAAGSNGVAGPNGADAAIVVTASHNPAADNGYKVYAADGAQISGPHALEIEALIDGDDVAVPGVDGADTAMAESRSDAIVAEYMQAIDRGPALKGLRVAYTALHGVGGEIASRVMRAAGHEVVVVEQQIHPDPDFPTTPFPNPEEPGTLDLLLALAANIDADVAIAHDPDADRLAAAIPSADGWRRLTGDEIGALLCEHLLAQYTPLQQAPGSAVVASTLVSGSLVSKIAEHYGAVHVVTSTGFKHLARAADSLPDKHFAFAYEEAYGYSVNTDIRDKDGISAALALLECAADSLAAGGSLGGRLDAIAMRHGVHLNGQVSHRLDTPDPMTDMIAMIDELRSNPPDVIADMAVSGFEEIDGVLFFHLAATDVGNGDSAASGRIAVRPSGTEPKLKYYLEAVGSDAAQASTMLAALKAAAESSLTS